MPDRSHFNMIVSATLLLGTLPKEEKQGSQGESKDCKVARVEIFAPLKMTWTGDGIASTLSIWHSHES